MLYRGGQYYWWLPYAIELFIILTKRHSQALKLETGSECQNEHDEKYWFIQT
jgi:hypothetical protein